MQSSDVVWKTLVIAVGDVALHKPLPCSFLAHVLDTVHKLMQRVGVSHMTDSTVVEKLGISVRDRCVEEDGRRNEP
jgi:hypothetical protein